MSGSFDIAIVGAGFGGSLLAAIARQLGRSVVLIEKGKHPRFAIGESTTRLSNLLLEELAIRYDLAGLKPLSSWGAWQDRYPKVPVGLNRGFSLFHHDRGQPLSAGAERANQLFVETSPNERTADTHWYRAASDQIFLHEAISAGAEYLDQTDLVKMSPGTGGVRVTGKRAGATVELDAKFVIDASGPRGFVHHAAGLFNRGFEGFPNTQGLYSHFTDVEQLAIDGGTAVSPEFPLEDTAVHHLFDGGWMWVLRFNNGLTSAGIAVTDEMAGQLRLANGEKAWLRFLESYPTLRAQFAQARARRPLIYNRRLSYLASALSGDRWVMLPSAAGFVDPMLSTGIPLTLLGVQRLAGLIETDWETDRFATGVGRYAARTERELRGSARLVTALYRNLNEFPRFEALSLLYFASTAFGEMVRRLGEPEVAGSFLLESDPRFGSALSRIQSAEPADLAELRREVFTAIGPFDVGGFMRSEGGNFYPFDVSKMSALAGRIGIDEGRITAVIRDLEAT